VRSRRQHARALCLSTLLVTACAPTLSKPRGEAHLSALAEAERHQHHGRLAEAVMAYERAAISAERRVDRDEALYRASRASARLEDYPRAIALCDRIAEIEPPSRRTLRARLDASRYRLELGDDVRAQADLRALVISSPDSGEAKSALRTLLALNVRDASHEGALAYVEGLLRDVKQGALLESLRFERARLLTALGRRDEARRVLEDQVARHPYPQGALWDDALIALADLAEAEKQPARAIAYLEQMLSVHESALMMGSYTRATFPRAALRVARLYRDALSQPDEAAEAYARVRAWFPKSLVADDALAEEGELWLSRGERDKGCSMLREVVTTYEVGAARRRAERRIASDCVP
jgi:tetratricopeptide (TPR) repeat protein